MSAAPQPPPEPLKQRIDALCAYAAKNGTAFLQSIVEKQSKTPEYSFLHGGPGADYYQYKLQAATAAAPSAQPAQSPAPPATAPAAAPAAASAAAPAAAPPAAAAPPQQAAQDPALATLPVEVSSGWQQVLGLLSGSRDSIRNSQQWFMACAPYAAGMAAMMMQQVLHLADYQRQLHVIYLANDILFKGLSTRAAGAGPDQDGIAAAFKPRLGRMLRQAYLTGGQGAEVQQNLLRVVNFWAERGVYDHLTVEQMTMEMMGITAPAAGPVAAGGAAPAAAAPPAAPQPQQPQQQAGAGAALDLAARAKAVAAAINAKQGMPPGGAPHQGQQPAQSRWGQQPPNAAAVSQPPQTTSRWGQQPPDAAGAAAASAASAAGPQPPQATSRWGQQPPDVAANQAMAHQAQWAQHQQHQRQQQQQPQHMAAAAAAYQQQQQGYPAGTAYPPPPNPSMYYPHASAAAPQYGAAAGYPGYAPPPGAAPGYAPPPQYPGQPGMPPPGPGPRPGYAPPPANGSHTGAVPPGHTAFGVPPPQQQYPGQPSAGYYPPPPGAPPGGAPGAYPPPPGAPGTYPPPPGPGQGVYYPPPPAPAPEPEPEPEGFDPMSFPPGLIPKLVEEKLKTDPPYSPLSILDIEQTGVPPPPKMDAYLKARVDKMYAQLADYRPGTLFSDIEVDAPRRGKHFSDREREPSGAAPLPPAMPDLPHAGLGLGPSPGAAMGFGPGGMPVDDGSFAGPGSGRGGSGLGWSSARAERRPQHDSADAEAAAPLAAGGAEVPAPGIPPVLGGAPPPGNGGAPTFESVFSSYRNMRSKGYHKMILDNAAKKFGR